jgi:3-hydroxy acid dehydrogenase/malonic semialdehyde reductase
MSRMSYRTALVTGASRGIGAAVSRRLAVLGLTVHAVARDREGLADLAASCGTKPIVADIRDTDAIMAALDGAEIDVLVNNAGAVTSVRPLFEQTVEEIAETIAVNLTAPLQLMRALLPGMVARQQGHVVNVTSTAAHHVFAGTSAYGGAKAGLSQASAVLRYDLAGSKVRITEVAPGRVETDIYLRSFGGDRARLGQTLYTGVRAMQPEDVAEAIAGILLLPDHVDVTVVEIAPTDQAPGGHVYGKPQA